MDDKQTSDNPAKPPSKPWFGALILGCLTLATVWILTYTLSPLPGQHRLGGWNYAIVGVLLTAFVGLSMAWRGDPAVPAAPAPAPPDQPSP